MKKRQVRKILIIEKDPLIQIVLENLCKKNPLLRGKQKISIATSLKEAKTRIKRTCRPGYVFSDLIVVSERMTEREKQDLFYFTSIELNIAITILQINTSNKLAPQTK